jgi:hypothetical protein
MNAVHAGIIAAAATLAITSAASWLQRKRVRSKKAARRASAAGSHGTGRVMDRRTLWARRYGAGGGWTTAAWTAGAGGLYLAENHDGVGDPLARCSGSPGLVGGCTDSGGVGDGVGCGGGAGCGGGGGCGGGS